MNSTQGAQYKAAYKKALSALSQAVTLNVALDEIDFGDITATSTTSIKSMLKSRMNVIRTVGTGEDTFADNEYAINNTDVNGVSTPGADNVTLFFNDGIMFSYDPDTAVNCTKDESLDVTWNQNSCSGFVDVNGTRGPNKVVVCDGKNSGDVTGNETCTVSNPTDIYPVMFYDSTVLPSTEAGRVVLYGK